MKRLIKQEKFDDFDRLLTKRKWDEVPFFKKFSTIEFMHGMSVLEKSEVLVKFSVLHLDKILDYVNLKKRWDVVILVSILDFDNIKIRGDEPVCPNFWISSNIEDELGKFGLVYGRSEDAMLVKQWLQAANLSSNHMVLTQPNDESDCEFRRVYVARHDSRNLDILLRNGQKYIDAL